MTNSSPPNPPDSSSDDSSKTPNQPKMFQKHIIDEWIAVLLTFGVLGSVIFFSFGIKSSDWNNPFSSQEGKLFSLSQDRENEDDNNLPSEDDLEAESSLNPSSSSNTSQKFPLFDSSKNFKIEKNEDFKSFSIDKQDEEKDRRVNNLVPLAIPPVTLPETTSTKTEPKTPEVTPETPEVTPSKPKTPEVTPETPEVTQTEPKTPEVTPETPVVTKTEPQTPEVTPETPVVTKTETKEPKLAFEDVPKEHWAYPFIQTLAEKNFIVVNSGDNFQPDLPITRAGIADLVSQAFQDTPETLATKNFNDVSPSSKSFGDINKAVKMGFMKGYSDEKFHPELQIPRYQVLVTLVSGLGLNPKGNPDNILGKFTDRGQIPDWAMDKVAAAVQSNLVVNRPGFDFTSLQPTQSATRSEVAAMIYQALVKDGKLERIESTYIVPYP